MVGSLLLAGLWSHTVRRSALPPDKRRDATIVVDECQNFLHLPIGVDDTLAEARGYRVSLVLAHQHQTQLPPEIRDAVNANARNKVFFTVSPGDASKLVRHVEPYFSDTDLARQPAFRVTVRTVHAGHDAVPFTVASEPLPPPVPGRAEALRAAARARTGLTVGQRTDAARRRRLSGAPGAHRVRPPMADMPGHSPSLSPSHSVSHSLSRLRRDSEWDTPSALTSQVSRDEEV
jgi:hypothetical protein